MCPVECATSQGCELKTRKDCSNIHPRFLTGRKRMADEYGSFRVR
jgi:hypothetical protein